MVPMFCAEFSSFENCGFFGRGRFRIVIAMGYSMLFLLLSSTPHLFPLHSTKGLIPFDVAPKAVVYRGRRAVFLSTDKDTRFGSMAVLPGVEFRDGVVEFDVAGYPNKNAGPGNRGFVGLAFRVSEDRHSYENFYLRMTNGRSASQELRNHAVQYCSLPDYTWDRLRKERPFRYEAYTDLVVGAWTHVRISVYGTEAKFWVGRGKQPCLIVHDLIHGDSHGKLALWTASHSSAYFSNLRVRPS